LNLSGLPLLLKLLLGVLILDLMAYGLRRVHHSVDKPETNSNYGIVFPWWDKILGTYVALPAKGHLGMQLGLDRFRTQRDLFIDRLLLLPFTKQATQRAKPSKMLNSTACLICLLNRDLNENCCR